MAAAMAEALAVRPVGGRIAAMRRRSPSLRGGGAAARPSLQLRRRGRHVLFALAALLALRLHGAQPAVAAAATAAASPDSTDAFATDISVAARPAPARRLTLNAPVLSTLEVLLSTERRAPIFWDFAVPKYSLTVPAEGVAAALIATVDPAFADTELALFHAGQAQSETLRSGRPSSFADVPTEEPTRFVLEVRHGAWIANYTVAVLRSTITANYEFVFPDPALKVPPQGTLTGLSVYNSFLEAVMTEPPAYTPQRSQYVAIVELHMSWICVVASKNDPDAELQFRADGRDWSPLQSGVNSPMLAVPERGWLLVEVRVRSPAVLQVGMLPLVYQVVVTRDVVCHARCRSCFGPGEDQCLICRAPLVLFEGRCEATSCPPAAYFEWESHQCRRCDPSCAQCNGAGASSCTLCPALYFLTPKAWNVVSGPCVIRCPIGTFAHPASRRCRDPPAAVVKAFYLQFVFRVKFEAFASDGRLQESILNATAFVLGVSISDVRSYSIDSRDKALEITIEVVSPFLTRAEASDILIDQWFGAFEVPVDTVESLSWDSLHPPAPVEEPEPFLPRWMMGLGASGVTGLVAIIPLYCFYFRRLSTARKRYSARVGVDPVFVDRVVNQSPAWMIRKFIAQECGSKHAKHEPGM